MTPHDPSPAPAAEKAPARGIRGLVRELRRRRVLRTAAWYVGASAALLQAADVFQQGLSLPEGTVRFLAVLAVCGLPVAIALSWAYDVSSDEGEEGRSLGRHVFVVGVVVVALTAAGVWLGGVGTSPGGRGTEDPMPPNRVAILALDAPGASAETGAFATYLQERLIEGLSAAASSVSGPSRLRVISRAGTLPFSDGTFTTDAIGRALRAGTLVSGVVEDTGERLRVRLQLIDAASAEVLDTRQVEAQADDAIRLVDAVADSLGLMVRQSLGGAIRARAQRLETQSEEAFQSLVRSQYWKQDFGEAMGVRDLDRARRALNEADESLARAEALDPRWVEPVVARAFLSAQHAPQLALSRGETDPTSIYEHGLVHADRAVRMSDGDARARYARGWLRLKLATSPGEKDDEETTALLRGAEEDLRLAAAESARPAGALIRLSELFATEGRLDEALTYGQRAYDEDPYLDQAQASILRMFEYSLRLDQDPEAARWCAEGRRRFPGPPFEDCRLLLMAWSDAEAPSADTAWALVARELGPYPAALRPRLEPRLHAIVAAVLARTAQPDSAQAVLARALEQDPGTGGVHLAAAGAKALLGAPELRRLRALPEFRALAGIR